MFIDLRKANQISERLVPSRCRNLRNGFFTHLETLFPILVLFQEIRSIDKDLSIRDLELEDLIIDGFRRFDSSDRFFEIDVERPEFEGLEESLRRRDRLYTKAIESV